MAYTSEIEKLERRWHENPKGRNFAPLADAYRKAGEVDKALELCRSGLELHPDYVSAHIVLGRCLMDTKDDAGATEVFQKVLTLDPENILALRILGEIAERMGKFDEAAGWLARLLAADPMNGDAAEALNRMKMKAAQAKSADPAPASVSGVVPPESVAEILPEPAVASEVMGLERTSEPVDLPSSGGALESLVETTPEAPVDEPALPTARPSLIEASTTPMESFTLERASGVFVTQEDTSSSDEPLIGERAPGGESEGIETYDGIDFGGAAPVVTDGIVAEEPPAVEPEQVVVEGLARSQYEGSGLFKIDSSLVEESGIPEPPLEPDGPHVDLPLIMPDDVSSRPAGLLAPPPRSSLPVPAPSSLFDDEGAADTAALSQAEPVLTETMAELYLQQGHRDDALRVYQALLERRPDDARLSAKVAELSGSESPVFTQVPAARAPSTGQPLGAFLKRILAARPGAPAADPLPEVSLSPAPRRSTGVTPQSLLAEAFADEPAAGPTPGSPSRPAADSLSLDAVFGEEGSRGSLPKVAAPPAAEPAAPAGSTTGGFSFDEFFGAAGGPAPATPGGAPSAAAPTPTPAAAARASASAVRQSRSAPPPSGEDAGDLDQFQAWLKGLKS